MIIGGIESGDVFPRRAPDLPKSALPASKVSSFPPTMSGFPVVLLLIVTLGVMTSAALFTPKGPHQVYVSSHSYPSVA